MIEKDFLEVHKEGLEPLGFWQAEYKESIQKCIENRYKTDVIKNYSVVDIVMNGDKVLVKWIKRWKPLTDEELLEDYGRK